MNQSVPSDAEVLGIYGVATSLNRKFAHGESLTDKAGFGKRRFRSLANCCNVVVPSWVTSVFIKHGVSEVGVTQQTAEQPRFDVQEIRSIQISRSQVAHISFPHDVHQSKATTAILESVSLVLKLFLR